MTHVDIRARFAEIRRLVQYTGPPGNQSCPFEELLIEFQQRETRAPAELVVIDGYPTGGSGDGSRSSDRTSSTERAALDLADPDTSRHDPFGDHVRTALDMLTQAAMSANAVRNNVTTADQVSSLKKARAHSVDVCTEDGCEELAVPGGRGRCEPDRKWLERHPDVQVVPRDVIEARKTRPRRQHENGPLAEGA